MQFQNVRIPERTCLGCGLTLPKRELIRVVKTPDNIICIDRSGKLSGRGAYICPRVECLKKALKSKKIDKSLSVTIPVEVYSDLEKEVNTNE